jgi:hypothetical protein
MLVRRKGERRFRTEYYYRNGKRRFAIFERTLHGTLTTEFNENGEVVYQDYKKDSSLDDVAGLYLGSVAEDQVVELRDGYEMVRIDAECGGCGGIGLVRELDLKDAAEIRDVPVVPVYVCAGCGNRFYSMTDEYLGYLVGRNDGVFTSNELSEKRADEKAFINELQEYIVRFFAAKKIGKVRVAKGRC